MRNEVAESDCLKIMRTGNRLLRLYAFRTLGNKKRREFRARLFKGDQEIQSQIPNKHLEKILKVRTVEGRMFKQYTPLCHERAIFWAKKLHPNNPQTIQFDLEQEAKLALVEAIYGYDDLSIKFITYAFVAIDRRLNREGYKMVAPLLPPTKDHAKELVIKYEKEKESANDRVTFDDLVEKMGLSDKQKSILSRALARVVCMSDMTNTEIKQIEPVYTEVNDGVANERLQTMLIAIDKSDLTAYEKDLVLGSVDENSNSGSWRREVAEKHGMSITSTRKDLQNAIWKLQLIFQDLILEGKL